MEAKIYPGGRSVYKKVPRESEMGEGGQKN